MEGLQPGVTVCKIWAGSSRGVHSAQQLFKARMQKNLNALLSHQVPIQGPDFTSICVEEVETEIRTITTHEALTRSSG